MPVITAEILRGLRSDLPQDRAEITARKLWAACQKYGITTRLRVAHLLAQLAHESGFNPVSENLNYSAWRLVQVWPGRFNWITAARCAGKPELIANTVYANRLGNGGPETGDGWAYRGRGYVQITGRANYRTYGGLIGYDLEADPSLALQIGIGSLVACAYWQARGLSRHADRDDLRAVTLGINGGYNGLDDRARYLARAKTLLGIT